jgi:hypothetical protein
MTQWTKVYDDEIGKRRVIAEQGGDSAFRVIANAPETTLEFEIVGETLGQLKRRLVEDGEFTEEEASQIANKFIYRRDDSAGADRY